MRPTWVFVRAGKVSPASEFQGMNVRLILALSALTLGASITSGHASSGRTVRLTSGSGGSFAPTLSDDGTTVAFTSFAADHVSGDTNDKSDVFVADVRTGAIERVSVASVGSQGNANSGFEGGPAPAAISANGRFIAFTSEASNFSPSDTNGASDVYLHDRQTDDTELISQSPAGDAVGAERVSYVSPDGNLVVFDSTSSVLLPPASPTCTRVVPCTRVFLRDRAQGTTTLISSDSAGTAADQGSRGGNLSADGRWAVFTSIARNLDGDYGFFGGVFRKELLTGAVELLAPPAGNDDGHASDASISDDGRWVAFASSADHGTGPRAMCSQPGGWFSTPCSAAYVVDTISRQVELVSKSSTGERLQGYVEHVRINADGTRISFDTFGSNLDPSDDNGFFDVYVFDRTTGVTQMVSATPWGSAPNEQSREASVSADGNVIAFWSAANNLVRDDVGGHADIFVRVQGSCDDDLDEDGVVSSQLHTQVEPLAGKTGDAAMTTWDATHGLSCTLASHGA